MRNVSAFQPKGTTKAYYPLNGNNAGSLGNGAVAYWRLDESSGNATDSIGGNTGTNSNVTYTTGKINNCAVFNGSSALFSVTTNASLQSSVFTYAAWVKTSSLTTQTIKGTVTGDSPQFRIESDLKVGLVKTGIVGIATSTNPIASNTWTHVAVTYDASGNYQFFVNGSLNGSGTNLQTFTWGNIQTGKTRFRRFTYLVY